MVSTAGSGGAGTSGPGTSGAGASGAGTPSAGPGSGPAGGGGDAGGGGGSPAALCRPLPPPSGNVIEVGPSQADELQGIAQSAETGDSIVLLDGTYDLNGSYLRFAAPGVTLRSKSGNREKVILDGGYASAEIVQIVASDVTIADVTLARAYNHPVHVIGGDAGDTKGTHIYNVRVIDPGQQGIKVNAGADQTTFADEGVIGCSHVELTDEGRAHVSDCYTGGVDIHRARGWRIHDNTIEGFWCESGLSEHAIHVWTGSRDTIVERNAIRDCARGVGLGLGETTEGRTYADDPCPGASTVGHVGGIVRNNTVFAGSAALFASQSGFDSGIAIEQACGARVLHNTVVSTQAPFSSIEWRFSHTSATITNNLVSHQLRERDGAKATLAGNLEMAPASLLADAQGGDLHLVAGQDGAVDKGVALSAGEVADDIDGEPRSGAYDVGADELTATQ
ncbi:right-handed parallel beta-helix repeat-containing protein [Sorangium sp. So ce726]|uniref:right-handed parallel beta-helix repeat-containing protein n=1 Tax=Sorangium sp. So ce726 TaxID=3133319 RepID=UPI003F627086